MMEAHSQDAPWSVPDTLACKHPEQVTDTERLCQLYSVQNLLLSTVTFSLGMGTEQGKSCQLWMQQQQAGPAWKSQWGECAGLELEPSQDKLKAQGSGKCRWGHQNTPNLQTHDSLTAWLKLKRGQGLQESKICFQLKIQSNKWNKNHTATMKVGSISFAPSEPDRFEPQPHSNECAHKRSGWKSEPLTYTLFPPY